MTDANGVHGMIIEHGIFTPRITGYTTAGEGTYTIQIDRYTRVGNKF